MSEVPIEQTSFDLGRLSVAVEHAAAQASADRLALEERIKSSARKFRAWRFAGVVGIVLGLIGIVGAFQSQHALDEFKAQRAEARVTSCEQDNRLRLAIQHQAVALASPEAIARAEEDPTRTQQALDFLRPLLPQRVCDPAAIAAYYASGGVEGVVPIDLPQYLTDFLAAHADE